MVTIRHPLDEGDLAATKDVLDKFAAWNTLNGERIDREYDEYVQNRNTPVLMNIASQTHVMTSANIEHLKT